MRLIISALSTLPEIRPGDDLASHIGAAAKAEAATITRATVVVVAQKVVSKAEGAVVCLSDIQPSHLAASWAKSCNRDARVVELALRQARRVVRMDGDVLITETSHGFVVPNSGVDVSNAPFDNYATILPADPDASARSIREKLQCGVVIVSDTFGRPWRKGVINVAIGVAGMKARSNSASPTDRSGRLSNSVVAGADEVAGAAGLLMAKGAGTPVVLIHGLTWEPDLGTAQDLIRLPSDELFR